MQSNSFPLGPYIYIYIYIYIWKRRHSSAAERLRYIFLTMGAPLLIVASTLAVQATCLLLAKTQCDGTLGDILRFVATGSVGSDKAAHDEDAATQEQDQKPADAAAATTVVKHFMIPAIIPASSVSGKDLADTAANLRLWVVHGDVGIAAGRGSKASSPPLNDAGFMKALAQMTRPVTASIRKVAAAFPNLYGAWQSEGFTVIIMSGKGQQWYVLVVGVDGWVGGRVSEHRACVCGWLLPRSTASAAATATATTPFYPCSLFLDV